MEVSVHEFKGDLAKLLAQAECDEKVVITRNGKPIFELRPTGKVGGFDFSADNPSGAEFGLDGPSVPVDEAFMDDPTVSRAVLDLDSEGHA